MTWSLFWQILFQIVIASVALRIAVLPWTLHIVRRDPPQPEPYDRLIYSSKDPE